MQLLSTVGVTPERPNGYGHVGVALATTLVSIANFLALMFLMRRRINRINGGEILTSLAKTVAASAVMSVAAFGVYYAIKGIFPGKGLIVQLVEAFVPIAAAGVVFIVAAKLLKIDEMERLIAGLRGRFAR
jgi:peptidoglycan biosynthesis protein MviN/MurJ (putative lipid II flippase)